MRLLALQRHIKSEAMCASHLGAACVPQAAEIRDTFSVTGSPVAEMIVIVQRYIWLLWLYLSPALHISS